MEMRTVERREMENFIVVDGVEDGGGLVCLRYKVNELVIDEGFVIVKVYSLYF